jgi:D-glycero-alpha-D-manno-heptose 1-phosphate guanylyltransferase
MSISHAPLPFVAMILAGGLGKRLRSVVSDRPKVMALAGGVPFLELLIESLAAKGVREFVLLTGYKSQMIEEHFRQRDYGELKIHVARELEPLGTGGAVRNAAEFATQPSLLINGDTFYDADLDALFRFHLEKAGDVSLSLFRVDDVSRYGSVSMDETGRVNGFMEKTDNLAGPGLINAGLSLLSLQFIMGLPVDRAFSMERDILPAFAASGKMFGHIGNYPFFDIGTPESYQAFQRYVEVRKRFF